MREIRVLLNKKYPNMALKPGDKAPDFSVKDENGNENDDDLMTAL